MGTSRALRAVGDNTHTLVLRALNTVAICCRGGHWDHASGVGVNCESANFNRAYPTAAIREKGSTNPMARRVFVAADR